MAGVGRVGPVSPICRAVARRAPGRTVGHGAPPIPGGSVGAVGRHGVQGFPVVTQHATSHGTGLCEVPPRTNLDGG